MTFMNQFKTTILLGLLTASLLWIGSLFGTGGLIIGLVIAIAMNFGSYWFSDKIVLKMYKAKPLDEKTSPNLYKIIKDVAKSSNIPMPKAYIIPSEQPNAFATGRNPDHAAVAVTKGILNILSEDELKGVIAHEMAHVKNRDTLIQAVASTIAGVISYVAIMARFAAIFGGFGRDEESSNLIQLLALSIITPLIATIIQMAISRNREYMADETGAKNVGSGKYLADALKKMEKNAKPMKLGNNSSSSLFIVNPFKAKNVAKLFSTHPPTSERIKRLEKISD